MRRTRTCSLAATRRFRFNDHLDVAGGSFPVEGSRIGVLQTRREEAIFGVPEHPNRLDERVRLVVHDDVVLAPDHLRLVDRQPGVLANFDFPILPEPGEIAVSVALRERLAMLDDRLLDLLRQIPRDDAGRGWREPKVFKDGHDARVEILEFSEGRVHGQHDAFALVGRQSGSFSLQQPSLFRHATSSIGRSLATLSHGIRNFPRVA